MPNGWYQLENGRRTTTRASGVPVPQKKGVQPLAPASPPMPRPSAPAPAPTPAPTPAPAPEPTPQSAVPKETRQETMPPQIHPDPYGDELPTPYSQTVGPRGPVVLQDQILHETLDTFVHSKTVERTVHVKGWGAFGHFESSRSMAEYTMLPFLQTPGTRVSTVSRFSLAVSTKGTPDTSRNVRGFSTKFYSKEGPFDLLCNHLPVFSVRDAIRFPESIKAFLPSPRNNLLDPERFWNFVVRAPEAMHFVVWLYSDAGTIKSLRRMRAYGVNTYVWCNAAGVRRYVKYHWLPLAGTECITAQEAAKLACEDPDLCGRDLWETIHNGGCAEYELNVQLMDPDQADKLPYDPVDDTKVWDEKQFPLVPVGRLTLDRNPENYQDQVERLAFSPSNLLHGAEFSNDRMLQGRSFVYYDAQRYRLGPDFRSIPVNAQEDWTPAWQVSSGLGTRASGEQVRMPLEKSDDFAQAGAYYNSLDDTGKAHLAENLAADLRQVGGAVRGVVLGYLKKASPALSEAVAKEIGA